MQTLVATGNLDAGIAEKLRLPPGTAIEWRSPVAVDGYAEYRDESFLRQIGLERLGDKLRQFWPQLGPQWDGLAVTSDGKVILVEAKAHVNELKSSCTAGPDSLTLIHQSLEESKRYFGARADADWTTGVYQYANRLAHLKFLAEHGVDAHLVFIYFLNDRDMGPASLTDWVKALDDCHDRLGINRGHTDPRIHTLYVDVSSNEAQVVAG